MNSLLHGLFWALGLIGTALLLLLLVVVLIIPSWSFSDNSFFIVFTISLWLSTFIIPGFVIDAKINIWTKIYQYETRNRYQESYVIKFLYFLIFVLLPIGSVFYSKIFSFESSLISSIPLVLNILLVVYFISKSGFVESSQKTSNVVLVIISMVCALILWYHPYFNPWKIFTIYLLTGEVVFVGIASILEE